MMALCKKKQKLWMMVPNKHYRSAVHLKSHCMYLLTEMTPSYFMT